MTTEQRAIANAAAKAWYAKHKEQKIIQQRLWRQNNASEIKVKDAERMRRYRALKQNDPQWREKKRAIDRKWQQKRRDINRDFVLHYKSSHPCCHCGETDPCCLDFHHQDRANKKEIVSRLMGWSKELLQTEIAKCIVLCANCHRKLHKHS